MRSAVRAALDAHLQTMSGLPEVAWENVRFEPPSALYLRATLLPASRVPINILAAQSFQVGLGIYQIDVFGAAASANNQGPAEVDGWVDLLERHFRPKVRLTRSGIEVHIQACESFGAVSGVSRYQVPVSVSWRAHEVEEE